MRGLKAVFLVLMLWWPCAAAAQVAVPSLTGRVVDQTATLSSSDIAQLDARLSAFEQRKGTQIAVLIVPSTQPETIEQFSLRVAENWKIGRKQIDDGVLLVVAKDDRTLRIEVGYGLEGALTDVTAKRIIDEIIVPKFRSGDFASGINDGVDRIIRVADGEPLPAAKPSGNFDTETLFNPFALFAVIFMGGFMRVIFGRIMGAAISGVAVGLIVWFFVGTALIAFVAAVIAALVTLFSDAFMSGGGPSRGGWVGGPGGGGFSRGDSGGGFSGGGGSFGGGGASGRW